MEKIIKENIDWRINKNGSYENDKTSEIIHSNNFSSEQNEQIKNHLKGKTIDKSKEKGDIEVG
jgi:hypothetical protein